MGSNISSQISKSYQESIMSVMNKFQTDLKNGAKIDTKQISKVEVHVINSKCTYFHLIAGSNAHVESLANLQAQVLTEITTDIYQQLENKTSEAVKQANEKLNLGQSNWSDQVVGAFNHAKSDIVNEIKTHIQQMIQIDVEQDDTVILYIENSEITDCTIDVSQVIDIINQQNFNATVTAFVKNKDINKLLTDFQLTAEQKNIGIDLGMIIGLIVAGVVAIIVVVIVIKLAAKKPKFQYRMKGRKGRKRRK